MNTFGEIFRFTDFGESHGTAVGGVIDGCPAGVAVNFDEIQAELDRRAGRSGDFCEFVSERAKDEQDTVEWLSGLQDGVTLGTPIAFIVRNKEHKSTDYASFREVYRPGHADYTYDRKYGVRAVSGGGRASARETVARVVAGAIAGHILRSYGVLVRSSITQIGNATGLEDMKALLQSVRAEGDSIGAIVHTSVSGLPAGVGEPVFDKLSARLAYAMLSINACKGFSYGSGFAGVGRRGSELNDPMPFSTNHAGGMLGGISNGQEVCFDVVFKPTPSIRQIQQTIDVKGQLREICVKGRHDVCVAIRAVPVVEAMTALALLDMCLLAEVFKKK